MVDGERHLSSPSSSCEPQAAKAALDFAILRHARLPDWPNRVRRLRTGRSPSAALHPASRRRSCVRLRADARPRGRDLHPAVCVRSRARSRAHWGPPSPAGLFTIPWKTFPYPFPAKWFAYTKSRPRKTQTKGVRPCGTQGLPLPRVSPKQTSPCLTTPKRDVQRDRSSYPPRCRQTSAECERGRGHRLRSPKTRGAEATLEHRL
jgi:hypothetical protein